MRNRIMCTHIDYTPIKCGMQPYALLFLYLYIEQMHSYVDGISSAINILPCWLDVDDAESPDCNDIGKRVDVDVEYVLPVEGQHSTRWAESFVVAL